MGTSSRRKLLVDTARGLLVAGLGYGVTRELGVAPAWAAEEPGRLRFGSLEPLVDFIATTPVEKIIPECVARLKTGTTTRDLVAAAALANARAFGGEDYVGFHTLMALAPAWSMSRENGSSPKAALPVLKVLYRNANRLKERGTASDTLAPVAPAPLAAGTNVGRNLRDAVRNKNLAVAEKGFSACSGGPANQALDALMEMVDDGAEVHRTVLVAKSLELAGFVGDANAHTLLRQSVHYCVRSECSDSYVGHSRDLRTVVPSVLEKHHLLAWSPGTRRMDAAWVESFARTILQSTPADAAEAIAYALETGIHPEEIGEALALGSNHLVLTDRGRKGREIQPGKGEGSVHGDSIGVHSGDSTNAWRAIARAGGPRTLSSSLVLAGYQLARDRSHRGEEILKSPPVHTAALDAVAKIPAEKLAGSLDEAIQARDQARAAAIVVRMGEVSANPEPAIKILRKWATTEDGALHGEKYFRTACDDFASTRQALRWRHLAGLARVTASAKGIKAPGMDEAQAALG